LVVPISLYEVGLQLHYQLKHYKDDDSSERTRDFIIKTAAMLGYFLQRHNGCIAAAADGAWDIITSVPPSCRSVALSALSTTETSGSASPVWCSISTFAASVTTSRCDRPIQ
jgi:hypothetical protein